jgi:hypothetical protein
MRLPFQVYGDLLSVPYLKDGRSMQGLDCVGVFILLQHRLGRILPFYESDPAVLAKALGDWVPVTSPEPGDGILIYSADPQWHLATAISATEMVHGKEGAGVVVERFDSPAYLRRIEGFYRWKQ